MANAGPHVKTGGAFRQIKRVWIRLGGIYYRVASTFIKVGGAYRETAVGLQSTMVVGSVGGFRPFGFNPAQGYGSMSNPTIGWGTILAALYASKSGSSDTTAFISMGFTSGSPDLPLPLGATQYFDVTFSDASTSVTVRIVNLTDLAHRTWSSQDATSAMAVVNWLGARVGQTVTVRGFFV